MKDSLRNIVNKNQRLLDITLGVLLLILGAVLLWDFFILAVRIGLGIALLLIGLYLISRDKNNYRVRFFKF